MSCAAPDFLLLPADEGIEDAWSLDVLDRATLAPLGRCTLRSTSAGEARPRCRTLAIDAPEALKPTLRRAMLRWHDQQLQQRALITLDDGSVTDTGTASPDAEALHALARPACARMQPTCSREGCFLEYTPGGFAWVLNLRRKFDGLLVEAGFAFPANTPEDRALFAERGCTDTDIRLRLCRLVHTPEELQTVLAEAEALRQAWFARSRDEVKKEIAARQKAFAARITAQLKPLGFRKKALHWTCARPDGWHVDFNAQKSAYTDAFYFNLLLTEPDKHPWYMGVIDERPLGNLLDWQTMPGEDFDDLLRAVVQRRILPLMSDPIDQLTNAKGG